MKVDGIQSNSNRNMCFKSIYLEKGMNGIQKSIAYNISMKLSWHRNNGLSYLQEIKKLGYDVLVINTEFNDPGMVRLCIIHDMKSKKSADGEYDFLDAKPVMETGMHFSAEDFLNKVELKTAPKFPVLKSLISKIFG